MLTCREMSEGASELMEGRGPWPQRLAARMHLLMCRHCRRYFRHLRLTVATVRRAKPPARSVDVERVLDAIERVGKR